jgi:C1A family cysteine protease
MKSCLAKGFPSVFGFTAYEGFESDQVAKTVNMQNPGNRSWEGHAVLTVGYNDAGKRVIVRNSWGSGWGRKGYFTMPYDYLSHRELSDDIWTIRAGELMIKK